MSEKKKQEIPMDFKLDDFFTSQEQRDDDRKGDEGKEVALQTEN